MYKGIKKNNNSTDNKKSLSSSTLGDILSVLIQKGHLKITHQEQDEKINDEYIHKTLDYINRILGSHFNTKPTFSKHKILKPFIITPVSYTENGALLYSYYYPNSIYPVKFYVDGYSILKEYFKFKYNIENYEETFDNLWINNKNNVNKLWTDFINYQNFDCNIRAEGSSYHGKQNIGAYEYFTNNYNINNGCDPNNVKFVINPLNSEMVNINSDIIKKLAELYENQLDNSIPDEYKNYCLIINSSASLPSFLQPYNY